MPPTDNRYYQIGGITIELKSDLPFRPNTFEPKFEAFRVDGPGDENITIHHHSSLPELGNMTLGREVRRQPPWAIYRNDNSWTYLGIMPEGNTHAPYRVAVFDNDHTHGDIYSASDSFDVSWHSLTFFPSDQIVLARTFARRNACFVHSSGVAMNNAGLLFVGHCEAGKSTIASLFQEHGEVLCDDRIVVRNWPDGLRIHGTWSHGDIPLVSPASAPLTAVFFLEKAKGNRLTLVDGKMDRVKHLLVCFVRPLVDTEWWDKMISLAEQIADQTPCYRMEFDKSGEIRDLISKL